MKAERDGPLKKFASSSLIGLGFMGRQDKIDAIMNSSSQTTPTMTRPRRSTANYTAGSLVEKGGVEKHHLEDGYGSSLCSKCKGKGCKPRYAGDTSCLAIYTKAGNVRRY